MRTLLLVAVAIAVPLLVLLPLLGVERGSLEREGRWWRIAGRSGSVLAILLSGAILLGGVILIVRAFSAEEPWSAIALSLFLVVEGSRSLMLFAHPAHIDVTRWMTGAYLVRAAGYALMTVLFVISAFVESMGALLMACLAAWLGAANFYFARLRSRMGEEVSE